MRHMHSLVPKEVGANGAARLCHLRTGQAVEVLSTAEHMREAQTGIRCGRIGSRGVAVIERTKESWGVK